MRRSMPLAASGPLLVVTATLAIAACSADTKDFREQGAQFIEGDEVRERFGEVRMSEAECEEPANTDKDTLYTCTAAGSDGNSWRFTIEITGSKSLSIVDAAVIAPESAPAGAAATAPESAPAGATTTAVPPATGSGPTTTAG